MDEIEIDELQQDDIKLLKTFLSSNLAGSSSNLFLHSKLDSRPAEIMDEFYNVI